MPRDINPGDIKVGPGRQVPGETTVTLGGPGMAGAGPNIGELDGSLPKPGDGGTAALAAHIHSGKAHPASAIYTEEGPPTLTTTNVEGQLDELAGTMPPEPPRFGYVHSYLTFTGIPDWGRFKMRDVPLSESVPAAASPNDAADIFPYYYTTPTPTQDPEFIQRGHDPETDYIFNSGLGSVTDLGKMSAGGYTRPPIGPGPVPVIHTTTIMDRGVAGRTILVSGALYPADRGVLAFMHWPADGDVAAFLAQDLLDRVKCAVLLGQGILGKGPCSDGSCDGGTGGIFDPGTETNGDYNPYRYPGQATGQYDLHEICTGVSDIDGSPLRAPWDDKDGDGNPGWKRVLGSVLPGPGQVRLGTDPNAGAPVEPYGIPVLGGDEDLYDDGFGSPPASPLGDIDIAPARSVYLRYRLPYLADYSQATGLKWTPGGIPGTETTAKEKARYFGLPLGVAPGVTELAQAGNFDDFPGDAYAWQVARYRFAFEMKYTGGATDYEEHGTYFFVHFKREQDFEAFVRDGVMPDDVTDGYEVYSAWLAPSTAIEDTGNRVNEETDPNAFAPAGPAPDYGYKALPYHTMRVNIFEDPDSFLIDPGDIGATGSIYTSGSAPAAEHAVQISGVTYFTPRDPATGLSSSTLLLDSLINNFWDNSYRTDDRVLDGVLGDTPPALLSSPNPAFIGLAPFAFETGTFTTATGAAGSFYTRSAAYLRKQRIEIPFTHLGGNINGVFSEANGPLVGDAAQVKGSTFPVISFSGDETEPSFTERALVRVYYRKARGNTGLSLDAGIQPFSSTDGHGVVAPDTSALKILYHSTSFDPINLVGEYGNFLTGVAPSPAYAGLETTTKDSWEKFLDEVYRYNIILPAQIDTQYGAGARVSLSGPGMGAWVGGPIETPVRMGTVVSAVARWDLASWVQQGAHQNPLAPYDLQVAGLPDRNPLLKAGAVVPFPSAGLLLYPQTDFSTGYKPVTGVDVAWVQPDYSAHAGQHIYYRVFDAQAVASSGDTTFSIRIDGLQLQDYEFTGAGPGTLNSTEGIAILVKIPGVTTWMDLGRNDGSGPSKQSPVQDYAGCRVVGPDTFDGVDPETGCVYSQIKVHVGPTASLFASTGIDGAGVGEIPILIAVTMNPQAASFNLKEVYDPVLRMFSGSPTPGALPDKVRGIFGIRLV